MQHSKHSRVCHDWISVNPLFIGVYATCICTLRILHLAVFSQFGKLALPLQFYMETYRSGHNGADSKLRYLLREAISQVRINTEFFALCRAFSKIPVLQFSCIVFQRVFFLKFHMEMYRRGHNENDSKSFCRWWAGTWVRIPPSPPRTTVILGLRLFSFCKVLFIGHNMRYN